jgi:hypothetical protein
MTTATPTTTPNLTLEELVKFMDVAVATKYGNDLMIFTHTITEEVHSTIDTFKTDLQNTLPQQIRSVMQQVHGESHSKQPDLEPSTPYPCSTPNPRVDGEVNDGVRDQIARTLREFMFTPKGLARSYQELYPECFDTIPYPWGFRVPDLAKFTGDDAKTTYEHIGQFLAQVNDVGITGVHKIMMFLLSLTGAAFNSLTFLPPNLIDSWLSLE